MKVEVLYADGSVWRGGHVGWPEAPKQRVLKLTVFHPSDRCERHWVGYDRYYVALDGGWLRVGGVKDDPADPFYPLVSEWRLEIEGPGQARMPYFPSSALDLPAEVFAYGVWVSDERARALGIL